MKAGIPSLSATEAAHRRRRLSSRSR